MRRHARSAPRRPRAAGVVAGAGGLVASVATALAWYHVIASVDLLDRSRQGTVTSVAGIPGTVPGWGALAFGLVCLGLGGAVVADRRPRHDRVALALGVVGLALSAGLGIVAPPAAEEVGGATTARLIESDGRLPTDVEVEVHVAVGAGPWVVLLGGGLTAGGALAAGRP